MRECGDCHHHCISFTCITITLIPPKEKLEDLADAAEVDLVGRLLPVLAPDGSEEECPGVAVAGVAVGAQADGRGFCLELPLFPFFFLLCLPVFLVSGSKKLG